MEGAVRSGLYAAREALGRLGRGEPALGPYGPPDRGHRPLHRAGGSAIRLWRGGASEEGVA
jgi:hypothetical protein